MPPDSILVINTGSSSLKLGLYAMTSSLPALLFNGQVDGIGQDAATLALEDAQGNPLQTQNLTDTSQKSSLQALQKALDDAGAPHPGAIGHRVVHGGPHLTRHQRITPAVLEQLKGAIHFAPLHIPMALSLIEQATALYPDVPQFACFDTAFHTTMPESAAHYPLPRELYDAGIRRYGFHGLSYESIVRQLGTELPRRAVFAHLGSGASLAAVLHGQSIATTMGLTPTGGIPMGTRPGDLDPGVLLHLLRTTYPTPDALEAMLNHEAGLKALGGVSDMRKLQAVAKQGDTAAQLAIAIFTTAIAKSVAAFAVELGGLDLLVFAGGIGEHSPEVRQQVGTRLGFLGIYMDEGANRAHAGILSTKDSATEVRIVPSEEDLQIALHSAKLLATS